MSHRVAVRSVAFNNLINTDAGSGARQDLATFKPDLGGGYFYLGPAASNHSSDIPHGIVVKELTPGTLVDVADWRQVWNDAGSGKPTDYALWRGVPPSPDYVVLASFFTRSHSKPTKADTAGIKAIHISAVAHARAKAEIWTDRGSGARQDGAVWSLYGGSESIETGAFVAVQGYGKPPAPVYGLNRIAVSIMDSRETEEEGVDSEED